MLAKRPGVHEIARLTTRSHEEGAARRGSFFCAAAAFPLGLSALWAKVEEKGKAVLEVLSIFTTAEAWISLITLIFLEIVLGVDNLVFITITTDRLPPEKQHIGRKLGLLGAMCMRILFLCFASFLVSMTDPLFTIDLGFYSHGFSLRDIIMLLGGAYLIYKGISEIRDVLALTEIKAEHSEEHKAKRALTLPQAVGTIMVMDVVFSIDSVITAVGMAEHLIVMILAVMTAVIMMMIFIDPISNFINKHTEIKILALFFITAIGILLVLDSLGITTGIELLGMTLEKLMVYFAMLFSFILELIQMRYNTNLTKYQAERAATLAAEGAGAEEAAAEGEAAEGAEEGAELPEGSEAAEAAALAGAVAAVAEAEKDAAKEEA